MMADHEEQVATGRLAKTDDEIREIVNKACTESAGKNMRLLGEEIIAMRQRIHELEREIKRYRHLA